MDIKVNQIQQAPQIEQPQQAQETDGTFKFTLVSRIEEQDLQNALMQMMEEMKIPFAYDHFAEGESPDPPFICFLFPGSENFAADDVVYMEFSNLSIELYADEKDLELEDRVEAVLNAHEIFWNKSEAWIESEKLYEVLYQMTV